MEFDYSGYAKLGESIGKLVEEKQKAYGDSFSKAPAIMAVLYPNGISPDMMGSALTVVRVIDKLNRISTNKVDLLGENPWGDIAGYSLLEVMKYGPSSIKIPALTKEQIELLKAQQIPVGVIKNDSDL
ncbi:Uncharacterised protein [uncultured archaeon]|nr:Uncharacterised protein [uncultured archaeon]